MFRLPKRLVLLVLLAILPVFGTGCVLTLLLGRTFVRSISDEVNALFAAFDAQATVAICSQESGGGMTYVTCSYTFGGALESSTAMLLSDFGIFGLFVDPLILQVPAGFTGFTATYDDGSGPRALVVQQGLASVPVQPGTALAAEAGQQLVIVDLPPGALPQTSVHFTVELDEPFQPAGALDLKALLAVRVDAGGQAFYVPMLPCVTDLASVPAITVPAAASGQSLFPAVATALAQSAHRRCVGDSFDFRGLPQVTTTTTVPGATTTTSIVPGATTTSTTLPAPAEACDNCLDDDGNGLIDVEDPACCGGGEPAAMQLVRASVRPRRERSRALLKATATVPALGRPLAPADLTLLLRAGGSAEAFCVSVPAGRLATKKGGLVFDDPRGAVATAGGLSRIRVRPQKDGVLRFDARGNRSRLRLPAGPLRVGWTLGGSAGERRCFLAEAMLAPSRHGGVRYP